MTALSLLLYWYIFSLLFQNAFGYEQSNPGHDSTGSQGQNRYNNQPAMDSSQSSSSRPATERQQMTYTDTTGGTASETSTAPAAQTSAQQTSEASSGYQNPTANSGYQEHTTSSGNLEPSANSGYQEPNAYSGYQEPNANSGYQNTNVDSGYQSLDANSGYQDTGAGSGYQSPNANSGYQDTSAGSGYQSPDENSGYQDTGAGSGYQSPNANSGYQDTSAGSGYQSPDENSGYQDTGAGSGYQSPNANSGYQDTSAGSGYQDYNEPVYVDTAIEDTYYVDTYIDSYDEPYKDPYVDPYSDPYKDPYTDPYSDPYSDPYKDPYKDPYNDPYAQPGMGSGYMDPAMGGGYMDPAMAGGGYMEPGYMDPAMAGGYMDPAMGPGYMDQGMGSGYMDPAMDPGYMDTEMDAGYMDPAMTGQYMDPTMMMPDDPMMNDPGMMGDPAMAAMMGMGGGMVPKEWTCEDYQYNDYNECNCKCGANDPDCKLDWARVLGCRGCEKCEGDACTMPVAPTVITKFEPTEFTSGRSTSFGIAAKTPFSRGMVIKWVVKGTACDTNGDGDPMINSPAGGEGIAVESWLMNEMNCPGANEYFSFRNFRVGTETEAELCLSSWSGGGYTKHANILIRIKPFPPGTIPPAVILSSGNLAAICTEWKGVQGMAIVPEAMKCQNAQRPFCKKVGALCVQALCSDCTNEALCPSKFFPACKWVGGSCIESLLDVQFTEGLKEEWSLNWNLRFKINKNPPKGTFPVPDEMRGAMFRVATPLINQCEEPWDWYMPEYAELVQKQANVLKRIPFFTLNFDERAQVSNRIMHIGLVAENRGVCQQMPPMCGAFDMGPTTMPGMGKIGDECVSDWTNFFQYIKVTFVDDDPQFIPGSLMLVGQRVCWEEHEGWGDGSDCQVIVQSGDPIQFKVHGLQRTGGFAMTMTMDEKPIEEQMTLEFGLVEACGAMEACTWKFSGDIYVIDQFNVIQNEESQIVMVKQVPDGENNDPNAWSYFRLTLESVDDPNVKAEIWSRRNDADGNPQDYFRIQYLAANMDNPQLYYIESANCGGWLTEKSSDWWEKKAGVVDCPTSGTHPDASFAHLCSGFITEDDCYSRLPGKGAEHDCVWSTEAGICLYPEFPNMALVIVNRMLNDDNKDALRDWYTNFDISSRENCPAVNDVTIDHTINSDDRKFLCNCNRDVGSFFSPKCYRYTSHCCSVLTNRCMEKTQCNSLEYSQVMWNVPQVVERGQVCDLSTNRCVYQFDCSSNTACNSTASPEVISNITMIICKKHRDCPRGTTKYTNVLTRKDRLAWYVTDQSLGLEFGLTRAQVFIDVAGCPDREGCHLQNPSLDWEKMKTIAVKAGEEYLSDNPDEYNWYEAEMNNTNQNATGALTSDRVAWLVYEFSNFVAIKGELRPGLGKRNRVEVIDQIGERAASRQAVSYYNPNITEILTTKETPLSPGCISNSTLVLRECSRESGYLLTVYGVNFGSKDARVFIGGELCIGTVHGKIPHNELTCTMPKGTAKIQNTWIMNELGEMGGTSGTSDYYQCPPGSYQSGFACKPCPTGEFSSTRNQKKCKPCVPGTYAPWKGFSMCLRCFPGSYTNEFSSTTCKSCSPGKYVNFAGATECTQCPQGQFAASPNSRSCNVCELNSNNDEWNTDCLCNVNFYGYKRDPKFDMRLGCKDCNEGMDCSHEGTFDGNIPKDNRNIVVESSHPRANFSAEAAYYTLYPLKGYMPMMHSTPETRAMSTCFDNNACLGGAPGQQCAKGYYGSLCADCGTDHSSKAGHKCETCPDFAMNILRMIGMCLLVFVGIILFIRETIKGAESKKSEIGSVFKIGLSFLQFNALATKFNYNYPPYVKALLEIQEVPANIASGVLSTDCLVQDTLGFDRSASIFSFDPNHQGCGDNFLIPMQNTTKWVDDYSNQTLVNGSWTEAVVQNVKKDLIGIPPYFLKALLYLCFPVMLIIMCTVVFCNYYKTKKEYKENPKYDIDRMFLDPNNKITLKDLARKNLPKDSISYSFLSSFDNFTTAVTMTFFLIYPSIVEMTFGLLYCKRIGVCPDDLYLVADMSVQCWTPTHNSWVSAVGVPMVIGYIIGGPLLVFYFLYHSRAELLKPFDQVNKSVVRKYHFLFKGYEPQFYYWELVVLSRKMFMVVVAVFLE